MLAQFERRVGVFVKWQVGGILVSDKKKKKIFLFFFWKQNFGRRRGNSVIFRVKNFLIGRFGDSVHDPITHRASSLLRPHHNNPPRGHITHFGNGCFGDSRQIAFTFSTRLETKPAPVYLRLIWGVTVTRRQQKQQMALVNVSSLVFFHLFARHGKRRLLSGCPVWEKTSSYVMKSDKVGKDPSLALEASQVAPRTPDSHHCANQTQKNKLISF